MDSVLFSINSTVSGIQLMGELYTALCGSTGGKDAAEFSQCSPGKGSDKSTGTSVLSNLLTRSDYYNTQVLAVLWILSAFTEVGYNFL